MWLNPDLTTAAAAVAAAATYATSDQVISTRERGELRWRIYNGLAHASQYYDTTSSSTAEVATLRLHHGHAGISTVTLLLRVSYGG